MDSAYMVNAMCQFDREEWSLNMVGTVQSSRTGGGYLGEAAIKEKEIEKGTHNKSLLYQHNTKQLVHAVWADNNFIKTLSDFHSPSIVEGGMRRRVRDPVTKTRDRGYKGMLIAMLNKLTAVRLIITFIKGMELKLSMILGSQISCLLFQYKSQ
jgi:hypothetical protein